MSESRPSSSASMYSQVTSAFTSRIPVLNTVVRRRTIASTDGSKSETPPPRTRSSSSLSTNSLDSCATTAVASGTTTPNVLPESLCLSRIDVTPNSPQPTPVKEQGRSCPIDRDTARAGLSLATAALNRLDIDASDTAARDMYIDAVKYMIRSLPEDLSASEKMALDMTASFPAHNQRAYPLASSTYPASTRTSSAIRASSARIVSLLLSALFSLLLLGIPIFALLFTRVLEYERRYRLSEKAVESTRTLAGSAGATLVRASKSRSGAYCLATVLCVIQNVLEGASDGINKSSMEFATRLPA